jgi:hypothetical protein
MEPTEPAPWQAGEPTQRRTLADGFDDDGHDEPTTPDETPEGSGDSNDGTADGADEAGDESGGHETDDTESDADDAASETDDAASETDGAASESDENTETVGGVVADATGDTADEGDTPDDSDMPAEFRPYGQYLADTGDQVAVVYADMTPVWERESLEADMDEEETEYDQALAGPLKGLGVLILAASISLSSVGLSGLVDREDRLEFETEAREILLADDALVVRGPVDADEIETKLQAAGGGMLSAEFEQADDRDGYTVYETAGEDEQAVSIGGTGVDTVAIGTDELIVSGSESVDRILETARGEHTLATEAHDPFAWLLSVVGDGDAVLAGYGAEGFDVGGEDDFVVENMPALQDATGLATSLTFEDNTVETTTAGVFEELTGEKRDGIEEMVGDSALDQTLTFDDDRVTLAATYDIDFVTKSDDE